MARTGLNSCPVCAIFSRGKNSQRTSLKTAPYKNRIYFYKIFLLENLEDSKNRHNFASLLRNTGCSSVG